MSSEFVSARVIPQQEAWVPPAIDKTVAALLLLGLVLLYGPSYWTLAHTVWATDEQGHGPIILGVSWWLLFRMRHALANLPSRPALGGGWLLLSLGLLLYALGRS